MTNTTRPAEEEGGNERTAYDAWFTSPQAPDNTQSYVFLPKYVPDIRRLVKDVTWRAWQARAALAAPGAAAAASAAMLEALQAEQEWREREAAGALDPEWDYERMVGDKRRAAIARAAQAQRGAA